MATTAENSQGFSYGGKATMPLRVVTEQIATKISDSDVGRLAIYRRNFPAYRGDKRNPQRILVAFVKIICGHRNAIKCLSFYRIPRVAVCRELREHQLNQ
jgi:hypothetical protein